MFGRRGAAAHAQPRIPAPPELRARVLASARVPSRVAYRGDLAAPRQRNGYPVPLDRIDAYRRRRTLRAAGVAAAVLAVIGAAFVVPTNSRQNVVGLLNSSRPASEATTPPIGDLTPSAAPSGSSGPGTPRWSPVPSGEAPRAVSGPISGVGGKCIEVADSAGASGAALQIMPCSGAPAQRWTVPDDGTVRAFDKCMHVHNGGTTDGTEIKLQPCDGSAAQQWKYQRDGALLNPQSERCLEAPTLNASDATKLVVWTCTKADNQYWYLPS
jgi:hypothetical protein